MPIHELLKVLPEPDRPVEIGDENDRIRIERILGTPLPSDLWEYARHYGSGNIVYKSKSSAIDVVIYNPFSPSFLECVKLDCNTLRTLKGSSSGDDPQEPALSPYSRDQLIPYRIFPEQPGLFPWGTDVNGNMLFWLTEGNADCWPVVVWPEYGGGEDFQRFDLPMTSFLAGIIAHRIVCKMWEAFFVESSAVAFQPEGATT